MASPFCVGSKILALLLLTQPMEMKLEGIVAEAEAAEDGCDCV